MKNIVSVFMLMAALTSCSSASPVSTSRLPTVALEQALPTSSPLRTQVFSTSPAVPPEATPSVIPSLPPLPSPTPPGLVSACLVGVWEVTNLPVAMSESLTRGQASLVLETVSGRVFYEFDSNGEMRITFNALSAILNGSMDGRLVRIEQSLDGSGTARYAVDALAEQLALSDFGGQGIQSTLAIDGQVIAENQIPAWGAFRSDPLENEIDPGNIVTSKAGAACIGNNLTLQAIEPAAGPLVTLERVQ